LGSALGPGEKEEKEEKKEMSENKEKYLK